MPTNTQSRTRRRKRGAPQPTPPPTGAIVPSPAELVEATVAEPRNHRELAEAIFAKCDPVQIGCELLESADEKGASVRARVFETLANWQFGKSNDARREERPKVRVIWDLPCPPHEPREPEE